MINIYDAVLIGKKLRKCRKKKNLSQKALAEQVGMKQNTIYLLENGLMKKINVDKLGKIISALDTTYDYVLMENLKAYKSNDSSSYFKGKTIDVINQLSEKEIDAANKIIDSFIDYIEYEKQKNREL